MVRRRVEINAIEENSKRHTTFTKRRYGLFKKTKMLCDMSDAEAAVIIFSKDGNVFGFGHPAVNEVINRYLADTTSAFTKGNGVEESVHGGGSGIEMEEEAPPLTEMETRIREAMDNGRPAWDVTVRNLVLSQLDELREAMENITSVVAERAREVAAAGGDFAARKLG